MVLLNINVGVHFLNTNIEQFFLKIILFDFSSFVLCFVIWVDFGGNDNICTMSKHNFYLFNGPRWSL